MNKTTAQQISDAMIEAFNCQKNKDDSGAIKAWNIVLNLDISRALRANIQLSLGQLHEVQSSLDMAYECMVSAIEANPNTTQAYFCLAYLAQNKADYQSAITYFKQALVLDDSDGGAWNNLGNCYDSLDQLEQAISAYNKAIVLDKNYLAARYNLANVYHKQAKYQQAIKQLNKVIALDNNFYQAYYNRGTIYKKLGNTTQAKNDLAKAQTLAKLDIQSKTNNK